MSFQSTTLVGHLGQDATLKTLENGRTITSFNVAYSETWKNAQGEKQEKTTWFNCAYFSDRTPGVFDYLRKGTQVLVTGKVASRAYLDRNQQPAASLELVVAEVKLLGAAKEQPERTPLPHPDTVLGTPIAAQPTPVATDDLPF